MNEKEMSNPQHQFIVSNSQSGVVRCCIHCGLSHLLGAGQGNQRFDLVWNLIREEEGDTSFSDLCPAEEGSDASLVPHHRFTLICSHGSYEKLIRFCVHCGLSHLWGSDPRTPLRGLQWRRIKENEQDATLSRPCVGEPERIELRSRGESSS
jgi:hypothetical protein